MEGIDKTWLPTGFSTKNRRTPLLVDLWKGNIYAIFPRLKIFVIAQNWRDDRDLPSAVAEKHSLQTKTMEIECYTGGFFQTNGYLLTGSRGRVLVDAPEGVAAWVREKGVRVDVLLLTHQHYDHVIDVAALKRGQPSCRILAHSGYDSDLTLESFLQQSIGWAAKVEPYRVDERLEGQGGIEAAGLEFEPRHVPGHSPDSLCYFLDGECAGGADLAPLLFGGDVLFEGGIGRTDFPHGDTGLLLGGIRDKVLTLPRDTIVYPGHGPETTVGDEAASNPFLTGMA